MTDASLDAFLATLRKSRLFDAAELDRLVTRARAATARALADALVASGDLTHYQADKLLRGRWQGLVLGPYTVLAPLGRGGMGTVVYLARDRRMTEALGDSVLLALKLLPDRKAAEDPKVLARFEREQQLGPRVRHPNAARTFAAGHTDDVHFLALEYVPGRTLRQVVQEKGPLPVGDAARVFADVAAALAHVHARGLVHRDVKPGNVMLRPDGRAVLLDFGLALAPGEPLPADPAVAGGRGYIVGTMDYLAPEQARNAAAIGPPADLYGLGCSLYYALTGFVPFPAEGAKQKVRRHRADPPPLVAHTPPELARFVRALMAKDPDTRPTADEARAVLQPLASAAQTGTAVSALAAADAPGLDADLWAAAPGDDLAPADPGTNPFARLEDSASEVEEALELPPDETGAPTRTHWLLAAGLVGAMALVLLIALVRRL
jgi:serine/threonine protein kinase